MMAPDLQMAINELVWILAVEWEVECWSQDLFGCAMCVGVIGHGQVLIPLSFSIAFHRTFLALLLFVFSPHLRETIPSIPYKSFIPIIWFFFFFIRANSSTLLSVIPLLRVFCRRWIDWVMGENHHGDHVHSVRSGPLLHYNVPGVYPSLYSRGGGSGVIVLRLLKGSLGGAEVIGGIATWSNVCGQLGRLSLLRLLALST